MNNVAVWLLKAFLMGVFFVSLSFSQIDTIRSANDLQNVPSNLYKLSFGIGAGTMDIGGIASFTFDLTGQFLSIRASETEELKFLSNNPVERVGDIGIIYGVSTQRSRWYASAGAGISYVHSIRQGALIQRSNEIFGSDEYEEVSRVTVGLPIQVEISGSAFPFFGAAIIGFANINTLRSYGGITLCIQLGKLR
jgi:hypothetical protein